MTASRILYALITLAALAFPVRRFVVWFIENGFDPPALWAELSATPVSLGLTGSLILASAATIIFIIGECLTRRDRLGLIAVPITVVFGVAVGLPFYLFLRLRPVD